MTSSTTGQNAIADEESGETVSTVLRAVVLDFDGLIVDTESPLLESWQHTYRLRGQELTLEHWQHALGTHGGFDPCAHLSRLLGTPQDDEEIRRQVKARNQTTCEAQPLLPGIADLLAEAGALGLGTAVASSSSRAWVEGWLVRHGVRDRVHHVCASDDVARVKPAPDLFLLAAGRLGVPPESCLVFEDSPNGVLAAQAAGMRCVAIPNPVTRPLPLPDPDLVLTSAADLPLGEIAAQLGLCLPVPAPDLATS